MKFLSAVLTSENINACKRALATIPSHADKIVVCNTLDNNYRNIVNNELTDVRVIHTESNGKPGQGKQSVIDYFLTTDYDCLIQIDGDDFLYPNGYDCIKQIMSEHQVDVIGLFNEDILIDNKIFSSWKTFDFKEVTQNVPVADVMAMKDFFNSAFELVRQNDNLFNRIICLSRKGATFAKIDIDLPGCEDLKLSALLKKHHLLGDLKYLCVETSNIYVYNKTTNHGNGFKVLTSNAGACRELFFKDFTEDDTNMLREGKLPYLFVESDSTYFTRCKYARRHTKKYE